MARTGEVVTSGVDTPNGERAGDPTILLVDQLTKVFGDAGKEGASESVTAVDRISFRVQRGELFTLLGPSGCGKTTTLRCIAGLERPTAGEISVDGRILSSSTSGTWVPANRRGLGMVFQSYAIWPHMNVYENVVYPLTVQSRASRPTTEERKTRAERVLAIVQLDTLAGRKATDLSGGQQQRLALARALIMEPPLLLLDEPLSNLDAKLREGMRLELKRLQRDLGITTVYVTHDQVEALAISSTVAVLDHGVIQQVGRPREIYERPESVFVADFIGTSNMIPGRVKGYTPTDGYLIETDHGNVHAGTGPSKPCSMGASVLVRIRPEQVSLFTEEVGPGPNRWGGKVLTRAFLGEAVDHLVDMGGLDVRARSNPRASVAPGGEVTLVADPQDCHVVPVD